MARLVLDTNSLIQCISKRSKYHDLWVSLLDGRNNLIEADPDDNKFIDCAIASNAKYIVTEDSHYNILKQIDFPKIEIIKLDDIIEQI